MKVTQIISTLMLVASSLAVAMPNPNLEGGALEERKLCKKPLCKAQCPDGTPYNCCVVYVRDPCWNHYCKGPSDFECVCHCSNGAGTYLCNANYFRDPCEILPTKAVSA